MKNFIKYLTDSQKTYEFKIKVANIDPTDHLQKIEGALKAYGECTVSKPKSLPITESNIDFPAQKAPQVFVMDVTLEYPCTDDQLRACLAEHAGLPQGSVRVVAKNHPEELWRNNEGELREYVKGESVIDKPYPENTSEQKDASKNYAERTSLLKELKKLATVAEDKDDLPQETKSPVGSNQNKIPKAKK